ncbi:MAG: lipoprotein [Rhodoplanes sp.]
MVLGLFAALGLAGCGRKGDLDPPSATIAPAPEEPGAQPAAGQPPPQGGQQPGSPRDRRILLDLILN